MVADAASRQNDGMRDPVSLEGENVMTSLPFPATRRSVGFPFRVAEFLLLLRLRLRRRSALCTDMLERAFQLVVVTCKNWFLTDACDAKNRPHRPHCL